MNDKSMPDVIWATITDTYKGCKYDVAIDHGELQYTRTQAIVELLEGMKVDGYTEWTEGHDQALNDAIKAIKDMNNG